MITLVTCHPYPTDNQRYVVYCYRDLDMTSDTDNDEYTDATISSEPITESNIKTDNSSSLFIRFELALYVIIPVLLVVFAVVLFVPYSIKKENNKLFYKVDNLIKIRNKESALIQVLIFL